MTDQTVHVDEGGSNDSSFGSGLMIGLVIIVLVVLGFFLLANRGGVQAPSTPATQEGGGGTEINLPSEVDVNVNPDAVPAQ